MRKNEIERSIIKALVVSAVLLVALFAFSSKSLAQSTTDGAIGGVVTDPSGAIVPGGTVTALNLGTGSAATATTDGNGRYLVIHLQPGTYSIEISAKGFAGSAAEANVARNKPRVHNTAGRIAASPSTFDFAGVVGRVEHAVSERSPR